jgi:ankyrin repeat protein
MEVTDMNLQCLSNNFTQALDTLNWPVAEQIIDDFSRHDMLCGLDDLPDILLDNLNYVIKRRGGVERLKFLLYHGVSLNAGDEYGNKPIHTVAGMAEYTLIEAMVDFGASIRALNNVQWTPFHVAASKNAGHDTFNALKLGGADINAKKSHGETPLHVAMRVGFFDSVESLVQLGADMYMENDFGVSVVNMAYTDKDEIDADPFKKQRRNKYQNALFIISIHTRVEFEILYGNKDESKRRDLATMIGQHGMIGAGSMLLDVTPQF